jgi:CBS domain-containing protein
VVLSLQFETRKERNMPTEIAREDAQQLVPTCHFEESLRDVRERVRAAGWDACVVVNGKRIVMGLPRADQLGRDGDVTVGSAMRPGPSTFRPHVAIEEMAKVIAARDLPNVPVTTSAGELIGLLVREDVERAVHERQGGSS